MAQWGLDVDQVRALSTQLTRQAEVIQQALSQLTSALGSTWWEGPDATNFRNEWQSTHTANLKAVITALQGAATKATQNANAQDAASRG